MRVVVLSMIAVAFVVNPVLAQPVPSIEHAYHLMYALDFDGAERELIELDRANPGDPLVSASRAANLLFHEFDRRHILQTELFRDNSVFTSSSNATSDSDMRTQFENFVAQAESRAQMRLSRRPNDPDALFARTLAYGLRADYESLLEHRNMAALADTRQATIWATDLLSVAPRYYDAYLATGISAYIVGSLPAPLRWMLRVGGYHGNTRRGMQEVELTAEHGRLLAPFARILLAVASIRNHDTPSARKLLAGLARDFPSNPLFAGELRRLDNRTD